MDVVALKLPYSLPIKLTEDELLLELLFIFYHDIGPSNFNGHFQFSYKDSCLSLKSDIKTYDEWIYSINGKSEYCLDKDSSWSLGECFRKTSLVACRDYGLQLELKSRDWQLKIVSDAVCGEKRKGNHILYYNNVGNYLCGTEFNIYGVSPELYHKFIRVLENFTPRNFIKLDNEYVTEVFERITLE